MLFIFGRDEPVSFWMHNTLISLDMIFIRNDGRILRIAESTDPLSDRLIPSGGPVRSVLEVIGGTARKLGIEPGDRVESAALTEPANRPGSACSRPAKHVSSGAPRRGIAQPGSAAVLGTAGRRFKSCCPDHPASLRFGGAKRLRSFLKMRSLHDCTHL